MFIYILFKNQFIIKRKYVVSILKINWLFLLFRELNRTHKYTAFSKMRRFIFMLKHVVHRVACTVFTIIVITFPI